MDHENEGSNRMLAINSVDIRYQLMNECVGFHLNVQCTNIGKASEEAAQHFDLLEVTKIHT